MRKITFLLTTLLLVTGVLFSQNMTEQEKVKLDKKRVQQEMLNYETPTPVNKTTNDRQNYIEIGDGTSYGNYPAYYGPWSNYWHNIHTQVLYMASEIGGAVTIDKLSWNFERIASGDNYFENVSVKIMEVPDEELTGGSYYDMTGATEVFSSDYMEGPDMTGWWTLDIDDFSYSGTQNLIIDVLFGDNGYYEYPYNRTFKTEGDVTRTLIGYSDSETPPNYDGATNDFDNIRIHTLSYPEYPVFDMEPESYDFGTVGLLDGEIFYSAEDAEFTVSNMGMGELIIQEQPYLFSGDDDQFAYDGPEESEFPYTINGPTPSTGEDLSFMLEFNPTTAGEKSTLLVVEDNLDREVRTFEITGSAYDIPDGDIAENAFMIDQEWPSNPDYNASGISFADFYDDYHLDPAMESDIVYHFTVNKPSYVTLTSNGGEEDFALFPESTTEFTEDNNIYEGEETEVETGSYYIVVSGAGDVDFNLNIQGTEPILVVEPESMDLGDVPIGCWDEGGTFKVYNAGGQSITFSDGTLSDENGVYTLEHRYEFPITITTDTLYFNIYLDAETEGQYDAAFLLTDDVTTRIYDITGYAYNAPEGDAFCNPYTVAFDDGSYEHDGTVGEPFRDNYHLVEGYNDVVYEFSYATDMVIDIMVDNDDIDPQMAVFSAEDLANSTPDAVEPIFMGATSEINDLELWAGTYYLVLAGGMPREVDLDYTLTMDVEDMPAPGAVTLIAPEDGTDNVDILPLLEWELGEYTNNIDLYVDTQYPPENMVLEGAEPDELFQFEEELDPAQIYFWKVVAHNQNGSTESETWAFTTTLPVPQFVMGEIFDYVNVHLEWTDPFYDGMSWTEDFEGEEIPDGWTTMTNATGSTAGWIVTDDGSSQYFSIPDHTFYAVANDDMEGSGSDGSMDYLITPEQNFEGWDEIYLTFQSFYNGDYSHEAYVELSTDGGDTWEEVYQLDPNGSWTEVMVDLSEYATSEYSSVWIGFHSDDAGGWASGWAVDDVQLEMLGGSANSSRALIGYNVYQNGEQINEETVEETFYDVMDLDAGFYTFGVSALYNEGESEIVTIDEIEILGMSGVEGNVTDYVSGEGIEGAAITITGYYGSGDEQEELVYDTTTNADGYYSIDLPVLEDGYEVKASASGYVAQTEEDVMIEPNTYSVVDFALGEYPNPVSNVVAVKNDESTEATVTWDEPSDFPSYDIYWDDGTPENATGWNTGYEGNMNAVKFTPEGYPATVKAAKIHIYDGSWPSGDILSPMEVVILDDDGSGGLPGTELGVVEITPTDYNWVDIDLSSLNVTIDDGSFYIANRQISVWPDAPPTAIDETNPQGLSYAYSGGSWGTASYDHFMIRATVQGPMGGQLMNYDGEVVHVKETVSEGSVSSAPTSGKQPGTYEVGAPTIKKVADASENTRAVEHYEVWRFMEDEIGNPDAWTLLDDEVTETEYVDYDWDGLEMGVYQYGVKAIYPITESDPRVSNKLPKDMYAQVVILVETNTGESPEGALVKLEGDSIIESTVPPNGVVQFDSVWKDDSYLLTVAKEGYDPYFAELSIQESYFIHEVLLREAHAVPINLESEVDCQTVELSWEEGTTGNVNWTQDFEGLFPPEGWMKQQNEGQGWFQTSDGSSTYWDIPPHDSQYACANDDQNNDDSSMDYLITPMESFQGFTSGMLTFESFFDGGYGQTASVELSTDGGDTWEVIHDMTTSSSWEEISIDLEDYLSSEYSQVWIGFHANDNGGWASGWAIDNVHLELNIGEPRGDREYLGFNVYRNETLLNPEPIMETSYTDENVPGGEHEYMVKSTYTTGESDPSNIETVNIETINPAEDLTAEKQSWNNVFLEWAPPAEQEIYTLQWDDGVNYTSIGTDGEFDFSVASRWYPEDLGTYDGMYLTDIAFFPAEENCEYYARVWTGSDATLVVDQMIPADEITLNEWNTVELDTPVQIDAGEEFWFGYRANTQAGYPAGCDAGPANAGKGDMLQDPDAGWVSMADAYGLNYNWNLAGTVISGTGDQAQLTQLPDNSTATRSGSISQGPVNQNPQPLNLESRELAGYNVYRNDEMIAELWQQLFYIDYDLDIEPGVGGEFTYYVVAEYASGCAADASNDVTVSYGSDADNDLVNKLNVYPVPARNQIHFDVPANIDSYRIINTIGQVMRARSVNGDQKITVNTEAYEAGAYMVQFTTDSGKLVSKRFVLVE